MKRFAIAFLLFLGLLIADASAQGGPGIFGSTQAPNANNTVATKVTCAATSTPFGVSGSAYLSVLIPPAGSTVCFAWGTNATATLSPPSECFTGGSLFNWGGGTGSCIVTSSTQDITVETNK